MTQEDKELLLKDLCARLPYGVVCYSNEFNFDGELLFINKVYNIVALHNDNAVGKFDTCQIADIKPYLRPMSSMTEEELREFNVTLGENYNEHGYHDFYKILKSTDWLNEHYFDYRGLIKKDLALEAPEGMYKIK